jgi:broad specificity phosphatase PhoE
MRDEIPNVHECSTSDRPHAYLAQCAWPLSKRIRSVARESRTPTRYRDATSLRCDPRARLSWSALVLTRIVIVRHGQTLSNGGSAHPVLSGKADLPLTRCGREQASALVHAEAIRGADAFYSSPLQRALMTAVAAANRSAVVSPCDELQEIDCGELDGMQIADVQRRFPDLWCASQSETNDAFRWPRGESYVELRERSVRAIVEIAQRHRGRRVVVVTHAGVISQLLGYVCGIPAARWSAFRPGNASVTEVDWERTCGTVVSFDRRDHLAPALRT